MASPTLWLFWDSVLSDCTGCPTMSLLATGSGATGSEGVKFNQSIASDADPAGTCGQTYTLATGPDTAYGFALTSVGSSPNTWLLLAHPAIGPAYYLLDPFHHDCSLGWSGTTWNLPATGANPNATGVLTITFA